MELIEWHRENEILKLKSKLGSLKISLHTGEEVPEHEEVEADEEPQRAAEVRHQGPGGVGLLFPLNVDRGAGVHQSQYCHVHF